MGPETLKVGQLHETEHFLQELLLFLSVLFLSEAAENVLTDIHIGKEGIVLEKVPCVPCLGREADMLFAVKQGPAVQHNSALVRALDAGDALEGQTFAAAGGAQQTRDPVFTGKGSMKGKGPQGLLNVHFKAHAASPPFSVCPPAG